MEILFASQVLAILCAAAWARVRFPARANISPPFRANSVLVEPAGHALRHAGRFRDALDWRGTRSVQGISGGADAGAYRCTGRGR